MKRAAVAYIRPEAGRPDALDAVAQSDLVQGALRELAWDSRAIPLGEESAAGRKWFRDLDAYAPDVVFNLIEGYGPDPRRQAEAAALLELGGWTYTGNSSVALLTTTDKNLTKLMLQGQGLATPDWRLYGGGAEEMDLAPPWIIKPAWEDASVGVDDHSVLLAGQEWHAVLQERFTRHRGQPLLVESFIAGREFQVSLLARPGQAAEVLPPAETLFTDWPAGKPRIVNYQAKWDSGSFEYHHTPRTFDLPSGLVRELERLALDCWRVFTLDGYARIDFRQAEDGRLFVIEINANPCLAPEAGFLAAAAQAGYTPFVVVERLMAAARKPA